MDVGLIVVEFLPVAAKRRIEIGLQGIEFGKASRHELRFFDFQGIVLDQFVRKGIRISDLLFVL